VSVVAAKSEVRRKAAGVYWRRLKRRPTAMVGMAVFLVFAFLAVAGPAVAPYSYTSQVPSERLNGPSIHHPFGTDQFGRDIMTRVIVGARSVFLLAGLGTLLAIILGTPLGLLSGYIGGLPDEIIMRLLDVFLSIPTLLVALVLLGAVGPSQVNLVVVVSVLYTPMIARVTRSMTLELRNMEFVEAARVAGERRIPILFREILPAAAAPLLVEGSMRFSYAIFLVASLGFLGLGVQPPSPDWGLQINEARNFYTQAPWMLLFPACAIGTLVVATSLMSDGIRQLIQPRRGGL